MKLNNLIILSILLLCLMITPSCKKGIKFYTVDNNQEFYNIFYEQINNEGESYIAFDLRNVTSYENGHIRQFHNYDLTTHTLSEFLMYLRTNYKSTKTHVYVYSPNELEYQEIMRINKEYNEIYVLTGNYDDMDQSLIEELFIIDKGPYDCGC